MRRKTGHARVDGHPGWVVGADEVGWGCMAGPLAVGAVAAPTGWDDERVRDSKQMTEAEREAVWSAYSEHPEVFTTVCRYEAWEVDKMGPATARRMAFCNALAAAIAAVPDEVPALVVVDGLLELGLDHPVISLPKADMDVPECALASVMAKVWRDRELVKLGKEFPGYGWAENKGYVTPEHKAKLRELGPTPQHRRSYKPVADIVKELEDDQPQRLWEMMDEDG